MDSNHGMGDRFKRPDASGVNRHAIWLVPIAVLVFTAVLLNAERTGLTFPGLADYLNKALVSPVPQRADPIAQLVLLGVAGLGTIILLTRVNARWAAFFTAASSICAILYAGLSTGRVDAVADWIPAILGAAIAFVCGAMFYWIDAMRTKRFLRASFPGILREDMLERIASQPSLLDGDARIVTTLSCSIRRFDELMKLYGADPAALMRVASLVQEPMIEAVSQSGGMLGAANSEGFVAHWNAPLDDARHAAHACDAALQMVEALAKANQTLTDDNRLREAFLYPVEVGIGIATGRAITGGLHGVSRDHYSIAGAQTRRAEHLRELSANYSVTVVTDRQTQDTARGTNAFVQIDFADVLPADDASIFTVLGGSAFRVSPKFRALLTFHEHIFQALRAAQWADARTLLDKCRNLSGANQNLYDKLALRISALEKDPARAQLPIDAIAAE